MLLRDNKGFVIGKFDSLQNRTWNDNGKLKILLIGDSYTQDLTNAFFQSYLTEYLNLQTIGISSECGNLFIPFSLKSDNISDRHLPKCLEYDLFTNETLLKEMRRADEIWLASHWLEWQAELLQISLKNISNMTNAKIIVFGRKDFTAFNPRKYLNLTVQERAAFAEPLNASQIELNEKMKRNSRKFQFIDTQELMCGGDITNCKIFNSEGFLKTYDGGHLTIEGAIYFGEQLKNILRYD